MSDPLEMPRQAAREMMAGARDTAVQALRETAGTALQRSFDALRDARTQDEIAGIRDRFVSSVTHFASTPYVTRR